MKVMEEAQAGTLNPRDCQISVAPGNGTVKVASKTPSLYEEYIQNMVRGKLEEYGVEADVTVEENGAIDYVIMARLEAALVKATRNDMPDKKARRGKTAKDRPRRSRLYVPGNNPRFINSVAVYGCDCTMLDLEDSVSLEQKHDSRYLVKNALQSMDFGRSEIWVRINKELASDDMRVITHGSPHGICVPKVESSEDIEVIEKIMAEANLDCHIMPILETAKGIANAREIARASERVVALAFGAEDYTRDTGGRRTWDALMYPRFALLIAAKASGIQALDTIYPHIDDEEGLREETMRIVEMGFDGKGTIHPGQIEPIHECFMPSPEEVEKAKQIISAIEEARKSGDGVATLDGRMIDLPVEMKARRVLKLAELYK